LNTEGIAGLLTSQGIDVSRVMEGRGGSADWLPEDAALACAGLPMRAEYAFRFRYAMDDLRGRIAIEITAHPPDRRARDLDNMLKAPLDALTHSGVIRDDADIDDLRITRGDVVPNGRVYIVLRDASTNPQECST